MEEVDTILLQDLRELGWYEFCDILSLKNERWFGCGEHSPCRIRPGALFARLTLTLLCFIQFLSPIPDEVTSIKELKAENFAHSILRCLKIIDKDHDYPRQLSKNITQRVNQTTQLVNRVKVCSNPIQAQYVCCLILTAFLHLSRN